MELWAPFATRLPLPSAGGWASGYPYRGVIHTTEGSTPSGAFAAYNSSGNGPHFTVAAGAVWQHIALDQAAKALKNLSGGVETNRARAVQIEVVGYAAHPLWSDALITTMRKLMVWLEATCGIRAVAPLQGFKAYPASYGLTNGVRMSNANWTAFNGWCGHQHVPENDHGDPGAIPIARLLQRGTNPVVVLPMYSPPIGPFAAVWQDETTKQVIAAASPDGAVYAWGCPFYGGANGQSYFAGRQVAAIGPRDDGKPGYMLTATSGERYRYGPA